MPSILVFERMDGIDIPYKGYKNVLSKKVNTESIMGSSALQSILVSLIFAQIYFKLDKSKYMVTTNESGLHLDKNNNLSLDIAIFKKPNKSITTKYFDFPPRVVIEVDIKADFTVSNFDDESSYVIAKSNKLIDFGVEHVIWIMTKNKSIFYFTKDDKRIVDFNETIHILDDCNLNVSDLMKSEEISF